MIKKIIIVKKNFHGWRIDQFVDAQKFDLTKRHIRRILDGGGIFINKKRIHIASYLVEANDEVIVLIKEVQKKREAVLERPQILFENEDTLIINKPPGLLSQETRSESVRHAVPMLKQALGLSELHLCHRLDQETSGALVLAKTEAQLAFIMQQFKDHKVEKTYHALVCGMPKQKTWTVNAHLALPDKKTGVVKVVRSGGRHAATDFVELQRNPKLKISFIECHPKTGRTHQIRVHLEHSSLPILGDKRYTAKASILHLPPVVLEGISTHHMLHAYSIGFQLSPASEETCEIIAPYPVAFAKILKSFFKT